MNVRLISVTQSVIPIGEGTPVNPHRPMKPEQLIVYAARVSNPSNQHNHETADKLLAYLIKHKHWSPFEMVDFCVEIQTSRAIMAQVLRHWSFSFQEFSQRYAKVVEMEPVQLRQQAASNRQSSTEKFDPDIPSEVPQELVQASVAVRQHLMRSQRLYDSLIDAGVAKECARMVLPLTTQTTAYMKASVRDWIHYLTQRIDPHAQLEHQQLALEIMRIFVKQFPNIAVAVWPNGF